MILDKRYKDFIGPRTKDRRFLSYQARVNKEYDKERAVIYEPRRRERNKEIKLIALSNYGPNGKLQCNWSNCEVVDPDMLTIDHINNDGAIDRKCSAGKNPYRALKTKGFPDGYQTLCWNHQWKKELMRRRGDT